MQGKQKSKISERDKQKISDGIRAALVQPSMVVESGGGYHLYFVLKAPIVFDEKGRDSEYERVNKNLIEYFQLLKLPCEVDPCVKDLSRLMRIPGSYNHKYETSTLVEIKTNDSRISYDFNEIDTKLSDALRVVKHEQGALSITGGETLLGDKIVENVLDVLMENCCVSRSIYRDQKAIGVNYNTYFNVVTFLTQLNRTDLAHEFAEMHPNYTVGYSQNPKGKIATDQVIQGARSKYSGSKSMGYITYRALGFEATTCGHKEAEENCSPIRHLYAKKPHNGDSKEKFCPISLANELNKKTTFIYVPSEKIFYLFTDPIWKVQEDDEVRSHIFKCLGESIVPKNIQEIFKALKLINLVSGRPFEPNMKMVAFRDAVVDCDSLLDFSKSREESSQLKLEDLPVSLFKDLNLEERKRLYLVSTIDAFYRPAETIDEFAKYLSATFGDESELIDLFQEIVGYCLIPGYPIHKFFMFIGGGGNGKSTALNIIRSLLGDSQVSNMNFARFNRFSTSHLHNKLLNITDEFPKSAQNWEQLKCLTGGGYTEAERKQKGHFSFESTTKFLMTANETPTMPDSSAGFWDRPLILPFENRFRGKKNEINNYHKILEGEIDAIGNWALNGLARLLSRREFTVPESVKKMARQAQFMSDSIRSFVEEGVVLDPRFAENKQVFYRSYQEYCKASGMRAVSIKIFTQRLFSNFEISKGREPSKEEDRSNIYLGVSLNRELVRTDTKNNYKKTEDLDLDWLSRIPKGHCSYPEKLQASSSYCMECPNSIDCKVSGS